MKHHWIENALSMGGEVTIKQAQGSVRAFMSWPEVPEPVFGKASVNLEQAITNLDDALMEDAAAEMQKAGTV